MQSEVDLLPQEYRERWRTRNRIVIWLLLAVFMTGLMTLGGASIYWRQVGARAAIADLRARVVDMRPWAMKANAAISELEELQRAREMVKVTRSPVQWEHFLADLSHAVSDDIRLADLRLSVAPADLSREDVAGVVSLSGVASNDLEVLRLIRALEASPTVLELELEMSAIALGQQDLPYNLFAISGYLSPALEFGP